MSLPWPAGLRPSPFAIRAAGRSPFVPLAAHHSCRWQLTIRHSYLLQLTIHHSPCSGGANFFWRASMGRGFEAANHTRLRDRQLELAELDPALSSELACGPTGAVSVAAGAILA
jgi:hypothetical protein